MKSKSNLSVDDVHVSFDASLARKRILRRILYLSEQRDLQFYIAKEAFFKTHLNNLGKFIRYFQYRMKKKWDFNNSNSASC